MKCESVNNKITHSQIKGRTYTETAKHNSYETSNHKQSINHQSIEH